MGSWLCENADASTDCATSESKRSFECIIVAAKSVLMNQYFYSGSKEFVFTHPGSFSPVTELTDDGPQPRVKLKKQDQKPILAIEGRRSAGQRPS